MGLRWVVLGVVVVTVIGVGCRRRPAGPRRQVETMVTPADAPVVPRAERGAGERGLRPGWARFEQRKTIRPGETVTAGPEPYARVKLLEVAEDNASAVFEAAHLVDRRTGRVWAGKHFSGFTPIFGKTGATLEAVGPEGVTVAFRWSQSPETPVPPGAVRLGAGR